MICEKCGLAMRGSGSTDKHRLAYFRVGVPGQQKIHLIDITYLLILGTDNPEDLAARLAT